MFTKKSCAVIYGLQLSAAQHMLDFDYLSGRKPSVSAFVNPWKKQSIHKLFYGKNEILVPSFSSIENITAKYLTNVDTLVNFASFRSAYSSTLEAMDSWFFKNIIIIAEWIPEKQTREIIERNETLGLNIVWPATVWVMHAWIFRAGNTGWSLENIVDSHLYTPGNVWFVSKSGGMSNELRRIIADNTNWTGLSIALWGDKYNSMDFMNAINILEKDESVKMIVMLGEIWGRDEIEVGKAIQSWSITKPVVSWCIGTINEEISWEVQFGHAWAKSNKDEETASYKNEFLKESWAVVPENFMDFGEKIAETFATLNLPKSEGIDISEKLSHIKNRTKTSFTSTISDERWDELTYNGVAISKLAGEANIGKTLGHLWLKKELPEYASNFLNTIIVLIADHWPAVSGATNAIVTARWGNDLKSSLISGLSTVWPRFGWAIDWAAKHWQRAVEENYIPEVFIKDMKASGQNIPWIGHKVKSKFNPDKRCEILETLSKNFPITHHLDFAKSVEALTLEKKSNLILNVDGYIAAMLLDIFEDVWMDNAEKKMYIESWIFNGFFLLARTIGFIWHAIDQKRLWEWLHRTSWDDILYTTTNESY